ncbi:toll/interleukin-1 receptor domain-containing protein [uncultured Catenibacterium sp.]|uniref:toll/interleukin-1 receptor domain-containing protein n=1 Tax=uncultured Catenibacterium sp. TaxID=286142 RepID=UPI00258C0FCA|nr:toll/interleukin-1 receptor domain-containing protein [uncultured Catenibacterium sp.]
MKNDLLCLIEQIDDIKSFFHIIGGTAMPEYNIIHDKAEFSAWKQELQLELEEIHDRTKDKFICSTLTLLKQGFNGWNDEKSYNELSGSLLAIRKNIDKYYPVKVNRTQNDNDKEEQKMPQKSPKVFISHSSKDIDYVSSIVDILEDIGLTEDELFCSSVPGYGIPLDEDIYEFLKQQFQDHNLHVILVLSNNYYQSVACMNEMGAAWVLQNKYTTILLPGFEFNEIKGAINPRKIGLKLDGNLTEVKEKLGQLKDTLVQEFGLTPIPDIRWERKRDTFISTLSKYREPKQIISDDALKLLLAACEVDDGTIFKITNLSGTYIRTNNQNFTTSQGRRAIAKWESVLEELIIAGFIERRGRKGEIFVVSKRGYDYIEQQKL